MDGRGQRRREPERKETSLRRGYRDDLGRSVEGRHPPLDGRREKLVPHRPGDPPHPDVVALALESPKALLVGLDGGGVFRLDLASATATPLKPKGK